MAVDSLGSIQENRIKYAEYFTDESQSDLSVDDFYTLLLAEMTNQDPMEPTSNTEFISQMANFTSLKSQQDALYYSNASYASSLVGKTVIVATSTGSDVSTTTGVVTNLNLSGDTFTVTVNGKEYGLKNVMEIVSDSTSSSSAGSDGAYATSLIGKTVTVSAKDSKGDTVVDQGVAESIEVKDGQFSVIVNGISYNLSDVVKVQNESTTETDEKTDESEETEKPAETTVTQALAPEADAYVEEDDIADITDDEELLDLFS